VRCGCCEQLSVRVYVCMCVCMCVCVCVCDAHRSVDGGGARRQEARKRARLLHGSPAHAGGSAADAGPILRGAAEALLQAQLAQLARERGRAARQACIKRAPVVW